MYQKTEIYIDRITELRRPLNLGQELRIKSRSPSLLGEESIL